MRILGLEGTAWAASAAIFDTATDEVSMQTAAYEPASGGIHPREAADHMAEHLPLVIEDVIDGDIDAVAFSRGPGLGPCLRVTATAARTVAQAQAVPLVGVNHMVAHLEVGRRLGSLEDPICLNASGANAHVLGYRDGRYRILGETMDTGVGNAIDKFTRHLGWSHPGGPKVERKAADGEYLPLPYVVKGMDFSFSGIMSAAKEAVDDGEAVADVCFSLQETIFAMLTEVTERALALTDRDELVLGGGVGQNARLQEMLRVMCADRGATLYVPEARFLGDNAGMIAMLGATMLASGQTIPIGDSTIRADYRPDEVVVAWRKQAERSAVSTHRGAEAQIELGDGIVTKHRHVKSYRHPRLDDRLRRERTAIEARAINHARRHGVPTPVLTDIDPQQAIIRMQAVGSVDLREAMTPERAEAIGQYLAIMHTAGLIHGDPTVRNVRVDPDRNHCYFIDFGLAFFSDHVEDRAMDLHIFAQSVTGTAPTPGPVLERFVTAYAAETSDGDAVLERLQAIEARGRYQSSTPP